MLFFYLNLTTCIIIIISTAVKDIKKYRMAPTYFLLSFLDAGFIIISYIVNIISLFTKPALGRVLGLLVLSLINKHTVLYLHAPIVDNSIYSITASLLYIPDCIQITLFPFSLWHHLWGEHLLTF